MAKRVIDFDPISGVTTTFDYDHASDTTLIGYEQDVTKILDRNKRLQNDDQYSKDGIKNEWWHEAHIPDIIILKWRTEYGVDVYNKDHLPKVKKLLQDPVYKYLKTTSGKF